MDCKNKSLSMFRLVMLNVAAILSLRGLPMIAETGLTMIFYLLFSSLLFLIPTSLISAELASGWPQEGGVYRWTKTAFGSRIGFLAIWLQWIQNVAWFPIVLAFAASSFAYFLGDSELASNRFFTAFFVIASYWTATIITFRGLKITSLLTTLGAILGTVIPGLLIIAIGVIELLKKPIQITIQHNDLLPNFTNINNISFLAGIILLFAGMEVNAVHACSLNKPKTEYPRALFISAFIIFVTFTLGSISIAVILQDDTTNLTAGVMQAFDTIFNKYKLSWITQIIGLLLTFGVSAGVIAWISGPSRGILATAKDGEIPPFLAFTNQNGIQTNILYLQGIIVTALSLIYIFINDVSNVFFMLTALSVSLYLIMYILLFLSAIKLRYSHAHVKRSYTIPGGKAGIWLLSLIGILSSTFALVTGLFPPSSLHIEHPQMYRSIIIGGTLLFTITPLILNSYKNARWSNIELTMN